MWNGMEWDESFQILRAKKSQVAGHQARFCRGKQWQTTFTFHLPWNPLAWVARSLIWEYIHEYKQKQVNAKFLPTRYFGIMLLEWHIIKQYSN